MMRRLWISLVLALAVYTPSPSFAVTNPLVFPAYDSDSSILHPDCMYQPEGDSDGNKFNVVATPYGAPAGWDAGEKVYLFRSNDGETWSKTGISPEPLWDGISEYDFTYDADPDILHPTPSIAGFDRYFIFSGPCMDGAAPNQECGTMLYTSTDGKAYSAYAGTSVNGNTNPIIQAGTSAGGHYTQDSGAEAWEGKSGVGKTQYQTAIYNTTTHKFWLWYGETSGNASDSEDNGLTNQVGDVGCATFDWNEGTQTVENFTRCAGNPIIQLAKDATYWRGIGHIDVTQKADGSLVMIGIRTTISSPHDELVWLTSPGFGEAWTYQGTLITPSGVNDQWDEDSLYRSSICADGNGRQVILNGKTQILYSGWQGDVVKIGWNDPTNFGLTYTDDRDTYKVKLGPVSVGGNVRF